MRITTKNTQNLESVKKARRRQADARWRANVTRCYETLKNIIPVYKRASQHQISKATILQTTHKHMNFLENMLSSLLIEKANMYKLDDPTGYSKAEVQKIKEQFIAKQSDNPMTRRVKKCFLKKARHCPTGAGDGVTPEEQHQAGTVSSLPETDDTKHETDQLRSSKESVDKWTTNDLTSDDDLQEMIKWNKQKVDDQKTEWNIADPGLSTEQSFSSLLESVSSQIKQSQNKTGKQELAKSSCLIKNKKKKRCVRRVSIQQRTDTSTGSGTPENRRSQVVPLLERSGLPITNSTPTNIDLQCVPEELQNCNSSEQTSTHKPLTLMNINCKMEDTEKCPHNTPTANAETLHQNAGQGDITPKKEANPSTNIEEASSRQRDDGCFTRVRLPSEFGDYMSPNLEDGSLSQSSSNLISPSLICNEPLSVSDFNEDTKPINTIFTESEEQQTPVHQRYQSEVTTPKKKNMYDEEKQLILPSLSPQLLSQLKTGRQHKLKNTKCRRSLEASFPQKSTNSDIDILPVGSEPQFVLPSSSPLTDSTLTALHLEGYMLFYKKMLPSLSSVKDMPGKNNTDLCQMIYNMWRNMSEDDRQTMVQLAHTEIPQHQLHPDVVLTDDLSAVEVLPLADQEEKFKHHIV